MIAETSFSAPVHDSIVDTFLNHNYWNGMGSQFSDGSAIASTNSFLPQECPLSARRMTHDPLNSSVMPQNLFNNGTQNTSKALLNSPVMPQDLFNRGTQDTPGAAINSSVMLHVMPQDLFNIGAQNTPVAPVNSFVIGTQDTPREPLNSFVMPHVISQDLFNRGDQNTPVAPVNSFVMPHVMLKDSFSRIQDSPGAAVNSHIMPHVINSESLRGNQETPGAAVNPYMLPIVKQYLTLSELADKVGVSRDWIRKRMGQEGFCVPQKRGRRYLIPDTEETLEKWRALKAVKYLTQSQLAKQVDVSISWIDKRINQEGFRVPRGPAGKYLIPDTEETIEKWKALKAKDYRPYLRSRTKKQK